jgi:hypothetical protein
MIHRELAEKLSQLVTNAPVSWKQETYVIVEAVLEHLKFSIRRELGLGDSQSLGAPGDVIVYPPCADGKVRNDLGECVDAVE